MTHSEVKNLAVNWTLYRRIAQVYNCTIVYFSQSFHDYEESKLVVSLFVRSLVFNKTSQTKKASIHSRPFSDSLFTLK